MLVPKNFVPKILEDEKFIARKLSARDVYLDFFAVLSSIDIIHQTRGGSWPTPDLTIEDDLIDLSWHQREFEFKTSFAFTIMNKDETECLGCIYFYPPRSGMSSAKSEEGFEVNVSWWITQKFYNDGMYDEVSWKIRNWIEKEWTFKRVFFSNKQLPEGFRKELFID
jgi:hypothetical protein